MTACTAIPIRLDDCLTNATIQALLDAAHLSHAVTTFSFGHQKYLLLVRCENGKSAEELEPESCMDELEN